MRWTYFTLISELPVAFFSQDYAYDNFLELNYLHEHEET